MRITAIDLQCEDIMWFGIDKYDRIFVCTSGGCGNVPEFICKSRENVDYLENFFMNQLEEFTQEKLLFEYRETNALTQDCIALSRKGIYCYDIYEEDQEQYIKLSEPVKPLLYSELPDQIQKIISENRVNTEVSKEKFLHVGHAYT